MYSAFQSGQTVQRHEGNHLVLRRFVLKYLLYMGVALLMMGKSVAEFIDLNSGFSNMMARTSAQVLVFGGMTCTIEHNVLSHAGSKFEVKFGCNGLEAVLLYFAAVLAFPANWKQKSIGLLAGFPALQISNILRIALLVYSGVHFKSAFEVLHLYVAQGGMIIIVLMLFVAYIRFVVSHGKTAST